MSLFPYDNNTFILQSFLDRPERVRVRINKPDAKLELLAKTKIRPFEIVRTGETESIFDIYLMPGHYIAFKIE